VERGSDNSPALLFNLLRANKLPPGGPRSYSLVE